MLKKEQEQRQVKRQHQAGPEIRQDKHIANDDQRHRAQNFKNESKCIEKVLGANQETETGFINNQHGQEI